MYRADGALLERRERLPPARGQRRGGWLRRRRGVRRASSLCTRKDERADDLGRRPQVATEEEEGFRGRTASAAGAQASEGSAFGFTASLPCASSLDSATCEAASARGGSRPIGDSCRIGLRVLDTRGVVDGASRTMQARTHARHRRIGCCNRNRAGTPSWPWPAAPSTAAASRAAQQARPATRTAAWRRRA